VSERLGAAFVEVLADTSEFGRSLETGIGDAVGEAAKSVSQRMGEIVQSVEDGLRNAGDAAQRTGKTLSRNVTAPLVGIGVAAVKTAMDFETEFAKIEGLVGVTGDDLEELRGAAMSLGPAYGTSGREAAEALFFITSAGLRGSDAIDVLEASLRGSVVGLGDVTTIADLATSAMNAYGSDILSASAATDVLTSAVREGKLEPADLAGAMGQTLPIASAMGISFDEVGAAFAAMSRTGTDANQAATQLRGIMTSILKPTVQAEEALNEMGLSSEGLKEQIREEGLLSVLETLNDNFADNEVGAERVFGNVRALSGVLDLMGANADGTREIFASLTDSTGILDEAFEVAADTSGHQLAVAMAEARSSIADLGETLIPIFVNDVLPILQSFAGTLKDLMRRFSELDPSVQRNIVAALGLAAALGPVLVVVGSVLKAVGSIVGVFGKILPVLGSVGKAFLLLGKVILANPIFLIAALLIAIAVVIFKFREQIIEALVGAWEFIKEKVGAVFDWFREAVASVIGWIKENWDLILAILTGPIGLAIRWIIKNFDGLRDTLIRIVNRILEFVRNAFNTMRDRVTEAVDNLRRSAIDRFNALVDWIRGLPSSILSALGNLGSLLSGAGRSIIEGLWNGMKAMWSNVTSWVSGLGDTIRNLKGPLTYDRVMLEDIGEAIIGGLGRGMQQEWRDVSRQLAGLNTEIPMTINRDALANMGSIAASTIGAGQATSRQEINVVVNNPAPEPASTSLNRELRKLSAIGVFGDD